jgi:uncharacterized protein (DUF58 family)
MFFYLLAGIGIMFIVSFFIPKLYVATIYLFWLLLIFVVIDILWLFQNKISASRILPEKLSNNDKNNITINIQNYFPFGIYVKIIDELPFILQKRDFEIHKKLTANSQTNINYWILPQERGVYNFGKLNIYVSTHLQLISRRFIEEQPKDIACFPSFLQLKKYDFKAISNQLQRHGIKKIRRIGHTMEFEQIKEYVTGDDIKTINWKATAKKNQLMINQYQDEKSQSIYTIIDKGRVMKMPFNGLSLLDYAINASLVVSKMVLQNNDKVGIFTFSKKIENKVLADRKTQQMSVILNNLYNVSYNYQESSYSNLFIDIKKNLPQRSLMLLYTNFETLDSLNRQLPYLKAINKNHLLVVIFFKNTELQELINKDAKSVQEIYDKVIAEKLEFEKRLIVNELKKYSIQSILTNPENLAIDTINKYLEIKSRGIL